MGSQARIENRHDFRQSYIPNFLLDFPTVETLDTTTHSALSKTSMTPLSSLKVNHGLAEAQVLCTISLLEGQGSYSQMAMSVFAVFMSMVKYIYLYWRLGLKSCIFNIH